jgi:hypothetical protein
MSSDRSCYLCGDPQWEWPRVCRRCLIDCRVNCLDMDDLCPDCHALTEAEIDCEYPESTP